MTTRYVASCPRCETGHYLKLRRLSKPAGPYSLWAPCERTGEPVFALERPLSLWNFVRRYVASWPTTHGGAGP